VFIVLCVLNVIRDSVMADVKEQHLCITFSFIPRNAASETQGMKPGVYNTNQKQTGVLSVERPYLSTSEESEESHSNIRSMLVALLLIAKALFISKCSSRADGFSPLLVGGFAASKGASLPTTPELLRDQD